MFWNVKIKLNENLNIPCIFSHVEFFLNHNNSFKLLFSGPVKIPCLGICLFLFFLELGMCWLGGGGRRWDSSALLFWFERCSQLHPLVVKVTTNPLKFCMNCRQPWERSRGTDYLKANQNNNKYLSKFLGTSNSTHTLIWKASAGLRTSTAW